MQSFKCQVSDKLPRDFVFMYGRLMVYYNISFRKYSLSMITFQILINLLYYMINKRCIW